MYTVSLRENTGLYSWATLQWKENNDGPMVRSYNVRRWLQVLNTSILMYLNQSLDGLSHTVIIIKGIVF